MLKVAVIFLGIGMTTLASAERIVGLEDVPPGAHPAFYYWSPRTTVSFGPVYVSPYSGLHPGYFRLSPYGRDLSVYPGYLVEHPATIYEIMDASQTYAIENNPTIASLTRLSEPTVGVDGGFTYRDWSAVRFNPSTGETYLDEPFGFWNFSTASAYSGRACRAGYRIEQFVWEPGESTVEMFCVPDSYDPEANLGGMCRVDSSPPIGAGNPVNMATGNKYQRVPLLAKAGPNGIGFDLNYNSQSLVKYAWQKWTHSFQRILSGTLALALSHETGMSPLPHARFVSIRAQRPDGKVFTFWNLLDWSAGTTEQTVWYGDPSSAVRLFTINDESTGQATALELRSTQGETERYALDGQLQAIVQRDGSVLHMHYDAYDRLQQVTNEFGRALTLEYDGAKLVSVMSPDGRIHAQSYDATGNLESVEFPDSTAEQGDNPRRMFLYEDERFPSHLTGVIDERGARYATWSYDEEGRAVSSVHADGVEAFGFIYYANGSTTVVDTSERERHYVFSNENSIIKLVSSASKSCASCEVDSSDSYTYDANGYVETKTDFNGNVTRYVRDDFGRELSRTEAEGTPLARVISTVWDTSINKPLEITEPGRITTFTYDTQGRLESRVVQSQP